LSTNRLDQWLLEVDPSGELRRVADLVELDAVVPDIVIRNLQSSVDAVKSSTSSFKLSDGQLGTGGTYLERSM
jgi:hypothetical protein